MKYIVDLQLALENKKTNAKLLANFNKKKPKNLDTEFSTAHAKVFREIDCLQCANCCKTTSPIFRPVDIKRISKKLRISEQQFISDNLRIDEDNDYVLKSSPCLFLGDDNKCSIYEDRPLACREYPHTDRKNMYQIMDLTTKNTEICPAVSRIVHLISQKHTVIK